MEVEAGHPALPSPEVPLDPPGEKFTLHGRLERGAEPASRLGLGFVWTDMDGWTDPRKIGGLSSFVTVWRRPRRHVPRHGTTRGAWRRRRRRRPNLVGTGSGAGAAGVVVHGPWRDVTGAHVDLASLAVPPDGMYPGRMNLGGAGAAAQAKRHQMVDRMSLRFFAGAEAGEARCEGDGQNRVGAYVLRGTMRRAGDGWDVEMTRTYTGPPPAAAPVLPKKRSPAGDHHAGVAAALFATTPQGVGQQRKPRAAAPPKGAWGAQPRGNSSSDDAGMMMEESPSSSSLYDDRKPAAKGGGGGGGASSSKKQATKNGGASASREAVAAGSRPCIAVIFGSRGGVATVHRSGSVAEAERLCAGLEPERECVIRAVSADSDGVLFPEASCGSATQDAQTPAHVIVLDVLGTDPPGGGAHSKATKTLAWKASVAGFSTARRAATYALHAFRTCGPQLLSLEWHAFASSALAEPRMALSGDGVFDPSLPITDLASLDSLAALKY